MHLGTLLPRLSKKATATGETLILWLLQYYTAPATNVSSVQFLNYWRQDGWFSSSSYFLTILNPIYPCNCAGWSWKHAYSVAVFRNPSVVWNIDCRCEDGCTSQWASCVTISNPDSLFCSETEVNPGIRNYKKHSSEWAWCQLVILIVYSTRNWRPETLQAGLEFDNIKLLLESRIFECLSWLNGSLFGRWWSGFSERGSQDSPNGANVAS
jgi:hypothetical protein